MRSDAARAALRTAARVAGPTARRLLPERLLLAGIWRAYPAQALDRYLVAGYQNPRINLQSVLMRHALIRALFGTRPWLEALMVEEIRFAIELNDVVRRRAAELGVTMGSYLDRSRYERVLKVTRAIEDRERMFERRWAEALERLDAPRLRVVEIACGSANDYRSWVAYGIAGLLDYTGIDLNPTNIANAQHRFPGIDFRVGNVLHLPFDDDTVDVVVASDIFEHLSLGSMEAALDEVARLARRGLVLSFFNMAEIPDHLARPRRLYHVNRLSQARIADRLRPLFSSVEIVPVARWLGEAHGYAHSHNKSAYVIGGADRPLLLPVERHRG